MSFPICTCSALSESPVVSESPWERLLLSLRKKSRLTRFLRRESLWRLEIIVNIQALTVCFFMPPGNLFAILSQVSDKGLQLRPGFG